MRAFRSPRHACPPPPCRTTQRLPPTARATRLQPAVPADQGPDPAEPRGRRMEARRGHPQRDGPGRALPRQPGHRAQGHRRTGGRQPAGAPPGQGHLRRHACRAARAVPLPAAGARQRRPAPKARPSATSSSASDCARRPRWRACWACAPATRWCRCAACCRSAGVPTILEDLWLPGSRSRADGRADGGLPGRDLRDVRTRVRRAHGARRGKAQGRRADAQQAALLAVPPARRCSASSASPTRTTTSRWNCGAACTAPRTATTAMT
jgi:hypothetical protein